MTPIAVPENRASAAENVPELGYESYELSNGLEVILHVDRSVPLVAVDVWYHVGSGNEKLGKSGFAHLFEHMMFQGAKHIGEDVHFELLRKAGASTINGTTNTDRTNYFEVVPTSHLETALWLESDRMGYLLDVLTQRSLDNQIDVVRNERRQRYDNVPFGKDRFAVAAALYPEGHPYRYLTIGRHEDLEKASLQDVQDFFKTWYVPSNATLTIAGDVEPERAKALVDKWFGSFPKLPAPTKTTPKPPELDQTLRQEHEDSLARFTRLHYVWPSPAKLGDGDLELTALAGVLGSSGWGRLYRALVVDEHLAQRVSAYQSGRGFSGEFHVVVDLRPGVELARVEPIVQQQLQRVLDEPVTDAELLRVTERIEAGFIWGLEGLLSRAERLQYWNHYADDPGYSDTYLGRVRGLQPDAVAETARKWLDRPRVEIVTRPARVDTGADE